jgi:hypothetical protein
MGLVACGGNSNSGGGQPGSSGAPSSAPVGAPSAQTLVNDALTALKSAKSVQLAGDIVQGGNNLHLNVGFLKSGALSGTMSGPFAGTQATFKLIVTGGKGYVLIDKAFFDALSKAHGIPASACSELCGKYVEVPASQFGSDFSLNGLTHSLLKGGNKAVPGVTTTSVNGQPAYRVSDGHGSYLYIAENSPHYPLEITKTGTGTLTFSQWNSVPPITAPPSSQIISVPGGIG